MKTETKIHQRSEANNFKTLFRTFQMQNKWLGHNTLGKQGNENN